MSLSPTLLAAFIQSVVHAINTNADAVTELDQAIGDGDHVVNLQRGLDALAKETESLGQLEWGACLQKIGMTLMSTVGGASGSLYGTLFISMSKALNNRPLDRATFAEIFTEGVNAVKRRGKSDVGEKTLLDVYVPVAQYLQQAQATAISLATLLTEVKHVADTGVESTRDMLATKGRASFLGERSRGHIDAGAKTAQLMITAIVEVLETATR